MTEKHTFDLDIIISVIQTEIEFVKKLLCDFEYDTQIQKIALDRGTEKIQGFDLAIQILGDVHLLAKNANTFECVKETAVCNFSTDHIQLERIRAKLFRQNTTTASNSVEFF